MKRFGWMWAVGIGLLAGLLGASVPYRFTSGVPAANCAGATGLRFVSGDQVVSLETGGMIFSAAGRPLRVDFIGANHVRPVKLSTASRAGNGLTSLERVVYRNLWDGIDLVCETTQGGVMKSSYLVAPGADPARIRLRYDGEVTLTPAGELSVACATGKLTEGKPVSWQETDAGNTPLGSAYRLCDDGSVGFQIFGWDGESPLVIDPVSMWNTFIGGAAPNNTSAQAVTVDAAGNVYIAGYSSSSWGTPIRPFSGYDDGFVAKLDASGNLIWNTFLGGSDFDNANGIALDGSGNVFVAGTSRASWGDPVRAFTPGGGWTDGFVAKLNAEGSLEANTFLGKGSPDECTGIALSSTGNVCVAGSSESSWGTPTIPFHSRTDAFLAVLGPNLALLGNAFLGGNGDDYGLAIGVGPSGGMFVAGYSYESWGAPLSAFTVGPYGETDAFVAKVSAAGALLWNTFLGSTDNDRASLLS